MKISTFKLTVLCFGALLLSYCSKPESKPINFGKDNCDYCMMTISDPKYGSELVTKTGKVFKFDSPECLASFYRVQEKIKQADVELLLVTDFVRPGEFIDARTAIYWESKMLRSPMGMNYTPFRTQKDLDAAKTSYPGQQRNWSDAIKFSLRTDSDEMTVDTNHSCADDSCACNHRFGEACKCKHGTGKNDNCPCHHGNSKTCKCKHE